MGGYHVDNAVHQNKEHTIDNKCTLLFYFFFPYKQILCAMKFSASILGGMV